MSRIPTGSKIVTFREVLDWIFYDWDSLYTLSKDDKGNFYVNKLYIEPNYLTYKTECYELANGLFKKVNQLFELLNYDLEHKFINYCKEGNLMLVKMCLEQGVDVNADNCEAISVAAKKGHLDIVKELLKYKQNNIVRALSNASENGHLDIVKELLKANKSITSSNGGGICLLDMQHGVVT